MVGKLVSFCWSNQRHSYGAAFPKWNSPLWAWFFMGDKKLGHSQGCGICCMIFSYIKGKVDNVYDNKFKWNTYDSPWIIYKSVRHEDSFRSAWHMREAMLIWNIEKIFLWLWNYMIQSDIHDFPLIVILIDIYLMLTSLLEKYHLWE